MQSVAIIVLNFNTPDLTSKLAAYLRTELDYEDADVYVVDNGSVPEYDGAELQLPLNLGFTKGMHEGYQLARKTKNYDAYWFLNSDLQFPRDQQGVLPASDRFRRCITLIIRTCARPRARRRLCPGLSPPAR